MRSKIYLILLALFAFSCSSDSSSDDGNNNNNGGNNNSGNELLVSEIIYNTIGSDYLYTDRHFYDGNKLTSIVTESTYQNGNPQVDYIFNFVYTNNKISRIDEYYGDNNNSGIEARYTFEYDNQGRISFYDYCYFSSSGTCNEYDTNNLTYSSNGIVSISYVNNVGSDYEDAGILTLQLDNNGNIISGNDSYQDVDDSGNTITVTVNASFEYDNQNSPFKNIIGMDSIILLHLGYNPLQWSAFNNCNSYTIEFSDEGEVYEYTYSYDYNEDGYPRQGILNETGFSSETTIDINYY